MLQSYAEQIVSSALCGIQLDSSSCQHAAHCGVFIRPWHRSRPSPSLAAAHWQHSQQHQPCFGERCPQVMNNRCQPAGSHR